MKQDDFYDAFSDLVDQRPVGYFPKLATQILTYDQTTDYDTIQFRVVPFVFQERNEFSFIEEKVKNGKVVADRRRHLSATQFASLAEAVRFAEYVTK